MSRELVARAKAAAGRLATLSTAVKNRALLAMAEALEEQKDALLAANERDPEPFGAASEKKAMADRLRLTAKRIVEMAAGVREVAALPDPVGEMPKMWTRPNGMQVGRVRVAIGVIGIIYESRRTSRRFCRALFEILERLRASGRKRGDPFEYRDCDGPKATGAKGDRQLHRLVLRLRARP
jgi:hypothetical protein